MGNEIWKDIKGYEGIYQISNLGRVKSLARKIPIEAWGKKRLRSIPERIMQLEQVNGYFTLSLKKDGKRKHHKVHRLVAESFLENHEEKRCVNHIDGNKENNCVDNLEWVTHSENMIHASKTGLYVPWNKGRQYTYTDKGVIMNV